MDSPTPPLPDDDAARWLAAAAARIEDDPAMLDALPDAEVERLLAAENARPGAVATGIRRRLREAERAPNPRMRLLRWPATTAVLALAALVAFWVLRPGGPGPAETILGYQDELATLVATSPLLKAADGRGEAAALLAEAASASPPDTAAARRAADTFAAVDDASGRAAFFAALGYRLAGDDDAAEAWFDRVPPDSPFADDARELR